MEVIEVSIHGLFLACGRHETHLSQKKFNIFFHTEPTEEISEDFKVNSLHKCPLRLEYANWNDQAFRSRGTTNRLMSSPKILPL